LRRAERGGMEYPGQHRAHVAALVFVNGVADADALDHAATERAQDSRGFVQAGEREVRIDAAGPRAEPRLGGLERIMIRLGGAESQPRIRQ
jgi:hypothetical protein